MMARRPLLLSLGTEDDGKALPSALQKRKLVGKARSSLFRREQRQRTKLSHPEEEGRGQCSLL